MNYLSPSDVAALAARAAPAAAPGWDDIFAAWTQGVEPALVADPRGRELFHASTEAARASGPGAGLLSIDDLTRLVMLRRLHAAAPAGGDPEGADAQRLDQALDRAESRQRGGRVQIEETLELARRLDIDGLRRKLMMCSAEFDVGDFILLFALPLMREVGELWAANDFSVASEHLLSAALLSLLREGALQSQPAALSRLKLLVATPFGELHELGALAACRLAQSHGLDPLYTGAQLPVYEIARLARQNDIRIIVLGGSSDATDLPMRQLRQLAEVVEAGSIIFTGGPAYADLTATRRVAIRHCRSMRDFCCQMEIMAGLALTFFDRSPPSAQ